MPLGKGRIDERFIGFYGALETEFLGALGLGWLALHQDLVLEAAKEGA
jgi:hypothetical protein